jgi:myosin heavy subunit
MHENADSDEGYNQCPEFPDGVFAQSVMDHFQKMTDRAAERPHLWALSQHCFSQAFAPHTATHKHSDQAMIITGESGVSDP